MKLSAGKKILAFAVVFLFVGLVALYVLEFHWLGNTFGVGRLLLYAFALGFLVSFGLSRRLTRKVESDYDKMRLSLLIIFIGTLFTPLFASLSNRLLSPYPVENRPFLFLEERPVSDLKIIDEKNAPRGWFIFIMKDGKIERVKSSQRLFKDVEKGANVVLPVKKGLWGFEFAALP